MRIHGARTALVALTGGLVALTAAAQDYDKSNWPDSITVGTASQGGTYFIYGSGWANMVGEELDINASGEVTGGPVQNAALVHTNDLNFGMVTMGPAYEAWTGNSPLAPGVEMKDIRAIFPMYTTGFQCTALASSGIASLSDLDGKTVGVGPAGGTCGTYWPPIFDTLGLNVTSQNGGASDLAGQMQDGLIDAFCFCAGFPFPVFNELAAQTSTNMFAFTPEEVEKVTAAIPAFSPYKIPAGTYESIDGEQDTVSMWNFAIANASMPDSLVEAIVATVMENNDRMQQIHPAASETLPENLDKNTFLLWHPGAVMWFEKNGHEIPDDLEG